MTETELNTEARAMRQPSVAWTDVSGPPLARVTAPLRRVGYRMLGHRAGLLGAVFIGGALGTATREAVGLAFPTVGIPWATGAINVVGALILGLLAGALTGRVRRRHQGLRLLLGTGLCGGFTTYSTFAAQTATLLRDGSAGSAFGYALGTLVFGAAAAWLGLAAGGALGRRGPDDCREAR